MIKTETRGDLVYTYSDEGYLIRQIETGRIYGEAYDVPNRFTYEETSEKAETSEEETADSEETKENV